MTFSYHFFFTASAGILNAPINGERANDASPWLSFEGAPLTYFNWQPGEPTPGDTLITISSTDTVMGSAVAAVPFQGYICQKP